MEVTKGEVWWHPRGYYKVGVIDVHTFDDQAYVTFSNLANAGWEYKDFHKKHFEPGLTGLKATWYEEVQVLCLLKERFTDQFVKAKPDVIHTKSVDDMVQPSKTIEFVSLSDIRSAPNAFEKATLILDGETREA